MIIVTGGAGINNGSKVLILKHTTEEKIGS